MFKLLIHEGPAAGTTIELAGTMIIGREGADVDVAGDTEMSRRHARLRVEGPRVLVEDLGSTNGTYVGGQRITSPVWLDSDTQLQLGLSHMTVQLTSPSRAPDSLQTTAPRPVQRTVLRPAGPPAPPYRGPIVPARSPAPAAGAGRRAGAGARHWWTLVAAGLGLGMNVLDGTVVNVALPSIQRDLHSSFPTVQWVVSAYLLSFAVLLATGGRLGDIFGRRRIFLIGVAVFALASAGCGVAPNSATLLVGRAIQGAGAALMIPATLALIVTNFPPELVPRAIGLWTAVTGVALAIGPVVGGVLTKDVTWRAIFYLNIPLALITFSIAVFAARESRDEAASRRIDIPGIVTVSLGLTAAVLAVIEAGSWGWTSARIIGLLAGSVVALVLFVVIEQRSEAPIVPPAVFRSLPFLGTNIAGFVLMFSVLGVLLYMAIYMQEVLGFSAVKAGLMYLPATVPIALLGPVSARLAERAGAWPVAAVGMAFLAAAGGAETRLTASTDYSTIVLVMVILGIGMGLVGAPISRLAIASAEARFAGAASGVLAMSRQIGAAVGVAVIGAVVQSVGRTRAADNLATAPLPPAASAAIAHSVGSGPPPAAHGIPPGIAQQIAASLHEALAYAIARSGFVTLGLAVVAGAMAVWLMRKPASGPVVPASNRLISELSARSGVFAIVPRVGVEGDVPLAQRWRSTQAPPSQ
ncbi:MAG TPA: DHA2 family efflux MFS transporter permease subunit [Solirubrobacteraceae bacterium]|nr:DHA2 family efflux MFS transporter permease subunit [Solirubrobacteraceae bacterium]